jgi:hypothetical protein
LFVVHARPWSIGEVKEMASENEITGQLGFDDSMQLVLRAVAIALVIQQVHELASSKVMKYTMIRTTRDILNFAKSGTDFYFWRRMQRDYRIRFRTAQAVLQRIDKDIRDQGPILLNKLTEGQDVVPLLMQWLKGDKDEYLLTKLKI